MTFGKQINTLLSPEDYRRLDELSRRFSENHSQIIRRSLNRFYDLSLEDNLIKEKE
jgi:hypothetical protein